MATATIMPVLRQPSFPAFCPVTAAVDAMADAGIEERGAIFTRREVVDFILDLSGYTVDRPLHELRLLEPSFGLGDFLLPAIDRLLAAWRAGGKPDPLANLGNAICAVELHRASMARTAISVVDRLIQEGLSAKVAEALADRWLTQGDFLLTELQGRFDVVVGNPPYVRQELIPDALMAEYRARYRTIYDRADIYVPFIERSLSLLAKGGQCGFICSDRWMKNRYGGPLRALVAGGYHLKTYVDMVNTPAFHAEVVAYPAITIIAREKATGTRIAHRPPIDRAALGTLAAQMTAKRLPDMSSGVRELQGVTVGAEPWILESSDQLALVRRLEAEFPAIEDAGCKVSIGVATGADKAFIGPYDALDVEPSRKLPLVMTRDIDSGEVAWRGFGVINPFADDGRLVELAKFPKLRRYLEARRDQIARRHVAQKAPVNWYRTIDRIYPAIAAKPKLLIPDIKGEAHVVYEAGELYPHHNLYFITSESWNVRALQAVLLSGIARLFVAIYSTQMRGGYLRFQAQYLRRIRLPEWGKVAPALQRELIDAAEQQDVAACNRAVFKLYGLSDTEQAALGGNGE
ncbi:TaqI-like C-terminal specificity domain-containing protein [Sphingomonas gellani]|uniref:site-specific DNA-methyltransferase (adenine-specific) n=1 Tax=Sphingomonas gellani TaxID=1166340 RepID=A0A1H8JW48_9SPHN|nr:Eco57I restriction-modification methylase domain-containing protein [Sphingomonas gellani]SEN84919.1 TaqI-like C-terminal specificity domain-containing protein [Sphingomonas gellani]